MQDKYAGRRDAAPYGEIRNTATNCNLLFRFFVPVSFTGGSPSEKREDHIQKTARLVPKRVRGFIIFKIHPSRSGIPFKENRKRQ